MRFHTQTAGVSLTAQQPEVNIVRTAIEALAAVLGGTQSLHTNSFDEALALPTEDAVRIALRTQQVIAHETGVVNTIDPLGGSYYVEELTNRIEAQAYDYFDRIEKLGGMVEAIKQNFPQREIADAAFRYQEEVERGERVVVGVNRYSARGRAPLEILKIDAALETKQIERVTALKGRRDSAVVEARLGALKEAGRPRRRQPDAGDPRRRARLRDDGRDVRRLARGLGHLARDAGLLELRARARGRRRRARALGAGPPSGALVGTVGERIRFAPPCTAAASASSGVRWPRVGPSSSAALERRLADEEVGVARELAERVARPAVAGVGEHAVALDAEAVRLHVVVEERHGRHLEAGRA